MISAFYANSDIRELKHGLADCWIIYVTKGFADFAVEQDVCHAMSNRIVFINTGNKDVRIEASENFEGFILWVSDPEATEIVQPYLQLMENCDDIMNVVSTGGQQNSILAVCNNLVARTSGSLSDQSEVNLLQELMVRLYRASLKVPVGKYSNRLEIVTDIQKRLRKDYGKDFTLEIIAAEYELSVSYLAHIFKEATGTPIMRFLLCCRVDAAKDFLENSAMSVNEIATNCGFHDISNFGRTFKKETGYSPREYRKRCRRAAMNSSTREI